MTDLTIILPLYGRSEFTSRFLHYWELRKLSYEIIFADKQYDSTLQSYYRKMRLAANRVTTPYAMLADNDDFLGPHGIDRCVGMLIRDQGLVAARGRQVTFRTHPLAAAKGTIQQLYWQEPFEPCTRVRYSVFRTEVLQGLWRAIAQHNPATLEGEETLFWTMASVGETVIDPAYVTYYSQAGTGVSYRPTWRRYLRFLKRRPRFAVARQKRRLLAELARCHADIYDQEAVSDDLKTIEECLK